MHQLLLVISAELSSSAAPYYYVRTRIYNISKHTA